MTDQPEVSAAERYAMERALVLAASPGVPLGPNPRVGCVLLDPHGDPVAEGHHRGAGTPHAEVDALTHAGERARGATAVVTLEPCDHTGRTGPCSQALLAAGVVRVVYAAAEDTGLAAGGATTLRAAGVDVLGGLLAEQSRQLNRHQAFATAHDRPFVTWKLATTLDGRSAAADGTSRWVSSVAARHDTHRLRARCDAILVGTETVLVDDPRLTTRDEQDEPLPRDQQLLRAVMGERELPADRHVLSDDADTVLLATRDPHRALAVLHQRGAQHVLLEGGATVAAAFVRAGLVDEVVAYVAPMLLGDGRAAVGDLGIGTITDACHLDVLDVAVLGEGSQTNLRLTMRVRGPRRRTPGESSREGV